MNLKPHAATKEPLVGRDIPLSGLYDHFCLVERVHAVPQISRFLPFGFITARCRVHEQTFVIPIHHKLDCAKVKDAFHFRSTNPDTEIVVVMPKQGVSIIGKFFRPFFPAFHLFAFPRGTYAKITDDQWRKDPRGKASFQSIKPLRSWPLLREWPAYRPVSSRTIKHSRGFPTVRQHQSRRQK
jgi:hypothetical protein